MPLAAADDDCLRRRSEGPHLCAHRRLLRHDRWRLPPHTSIRRPLERPAALCSFYDAIEQHTGLVQGKEVWRDADAAKIEPAACIAEFRPAALGGHFTPLMVASCLASHSLGISTYCWNIHPAPHALFGPQGAGDGLAGRGAPICTRRAAAAAQHSGCTAAPGQECRGRVQTCW